MTASKIVAAAASSAGGSSLDVDDVFRTFLYSGNGSTQTITNNIDLSGEGGLVWLKSRTTTDAHYLFDTERGFTSGAGNFISTNSVNAQANTGSFGVSSFNSDGFALHGDWNGANQSGEDFASWTFRKSKKFFDVVTFTGNGASRAISHGLDCVPGMVAIRAISDYGGNNGGFAIMHNYGTANLSAALTAMNINRSDGNALGNNVTTDFSSHFTSTTFNPHVIKDTGYERQNLSGITYVAYLFAHNTGDGIFGPDEDQDIIKCGKYTGNGGSQEIDLGFEPSWVLVKNTSDNSTNWGIFDTQRFWYDQAGSGDSKYLIAQTTAAEAGIARFYPHATGFGYTADSNTQINTSGKHYIYMAIRKGPLSPPGSASEVFDVAAATGASGATPQFISTGFKTDFAIYRPNISGNGQYNRLSSRLTGIEHLKINATDVRSNDSNQVWDYENGHRDQSADAEHFSWMWKRAPKFCDVVCWLGNASARTLTHNLDAVPEMMIVRARTITEDWMVYHKDIGNGRYLEPNSSAAKSGSDSSAWWNSTTPTSSVFSVGNHSRVNSNGAYYIGYLFTTLAGISKVGSVAHSNGSTTNVDCGFSNGARFVIMKSTESGVWRLWDSERGIVAGNDWYVQLNTTDGQVKNGDLIDPYSAGFAVAPSGSTETSIFYAVAV